MAIWLYFNMKKEEITKVYKLDLEILKDKSEKIIAIAKLLKLADKGKELDWHDFNTVLDTITSLSIEISNGVGEVIYTEANDD